MMRMCFGDSEQKGSVMIMKAEGTIIAAKRTGHRASVPSSSGKPSTWDITIEIVITN